MKCVIKFYINRSNIFQIYKKNLPQKPLIPLLQIVHPIHLAFEKHLLRWIIFYDSMQEILPFLIEPLQKIFRCVIQRFYGLCSYHAIGCNIKHSLRYFNTINTTSPNPIYQSIRYCFEVRPAWSGVTQAVSRVTSIYRLFNLIKKVIFLFANLKKCIIFAIQGVG